MIRETPFLAHRVHYDLVTPTIVVEFVEKDEHENEHLRHLHVKEYFEKFPLPTKSFSLQELFDSGVPVKPVNPAIYESKDSTDYGFSQSDVLDAAKELKERMENEQTKTE